MSDIKIIKQKGRVYIDLLTLKDVLVRTQDGLDGLEADNPTMEIHKEARIDSLGEIIKLLDNVGGV